MGKALTEAAPLIPALAPYIPRVSAALESGGFRVNPANFVGAAPAATLASRAGDMALRTGAAGTVGGATVGMIDPENAGTGAMIGAAIPGGVKVAGAVGGAVRDMAGWGARNIAGLTTGAGSEAIKTAYQAGKSGAQEFVDNMRGKVPMTDVLDDAKNALSTMRTQRGDLYRSGMVDIKADKAVIDITPIANLVKNIQSIGSFKGQVINKNAAGAIDEVAAKVQEWVKLNPAEYHTPEGLDALKQAIGDIADPLQHGTKARKAVDEIYHAVKKQITDQAPVYSKVMKSYADASEQITEIQKALSLGNKASVDTSMRKLQSLMRNNVNTNYGNRLSLARDLEKAGNKELLPAIAGQALSSPTPRGLQGLAASGTTLMSFANPAFLAALPMQSPRVMGELFYGAGKLRSLAGRGANNVINQPAISQSMARLPNRQTLSSLMTVAPSVAYSR